MSELSVRGPSALFLTWALHDVEEALTFPQLFDRLADRTGLEWLRMNRRQSWYAVGLMGILVGLSSMRGARSGERSDLYSLTVAGFEAHVAAHLAGSLLQRTYTPGVATAVPVVLPGALIAKRDLARSGRPLHLRDYLRAGLLLPPAAAVCHALARLAPAGRGAGQVQ